MRFRRALAGIGLSFLLGIEALAGTNYVSLTGSEVLPYNSWQTASRSIQPAVNAASSGNTILIEPGRYPVFSPIDVRKLVTIRGTGKREQTIIDGQGISQGMTIYTYPARIQNITFENCTASLGGAVYISKYGGLENCIFRFCDASSEGGGVFLSRGGYAKDCVFYGNSADFRGGGISITAGKITAQDQIGRGRAENCVVVDNSSYVGGDICAYLGGEIIGNITSSNGLDTVSFNVYGGTLENNIERRDYTREERVPRIIGLSPVGFSFGSLPWIVYSIRELDLEGGDEETEVYVGRGGMVLIKFPEQDRGIFRVEAYKK